MRKSVLAWTSGVMIVLGATICWAIALWREVFIGTFAIGTVVAPAIAAFATTLIYRPKSLLRSIVMGLLSATMQVLLNALVQLAGQRVDFPGMRGAIYFSVIAIVIGVGLALTGWVIGLVVRELLDNWRRE